MRQRRSGRAWRVPSPEHGGSARTRSNGPSSRGSAASPTWTSTIVAPMRAAVVRSCSARSGCCSTLTISALVLHERGEVRALAAGRRAEVEHALAGLRVEERRDALRRARHRHVVALVPERVAVGVERPVRRAPRRAPRARRRAAPIAAASSSGVVFRRLARSASSDGSFRRRMSCEACSAPYASRQSSASQSGYDSRTASGAAASSSSPSRVARRRTALTRPLPRLRLTSSTDSATAACGGTPSRKSSWKSPSRSAARTGASSLPLREPVDDVVERAAALDGAERQLARERPLARVEALGLGVQRLVGEGLLLEDAADDAEGRAAGRRCRHVCRG